ncbi:MAG TPA: hypothetical protein VFE58_08310 [Tepidisphaeraceae bacterium]|jgi:hypothetical protein|nr:hypothetical protein [Tepidisphaeraceae bacterium]
MRYQHRPIIVASAAMSIVAIASLWTPVAQADPLPGEVLKFQQLPINNLPIAGALYQGHDELSTAYAQVGTNGNVTGWQGDFMADDFADKFSTPVVHLSWWGSYLNGVPTSGGVQQFMISFETDVPQVPGATFSHPGQPLLSQIVTLGALTPASGTFTEQLVNGSVPEPLYKYNAELAVPFAEQPNTVYWLKIVALTGDQSLSWGWHDRDYTVMDPLASQAPAVNPGEINLVNPATPVWHFQDDAVSGRLTVSPNPAVGGPLVNVVQDPATYAPHDYIDNIDGPPGIGQYSKDLAFELYTTVPEPAGAGVLLLAGMLGARRRRI